MNNNKQPFISILIPNFNKLEGIAKSIETACEQTVKKDCFEVIVVDDKSTDASPKLIKKYLQKYKNLHYFQNAKNLGLSQTRNVLLSKKSLQAKWIIWLDGGDYISKEFIECFYIWLNDPEIKNKNLVKSNWKMTKKHAKSVFHKMKYKFDDRIMVRVIKADLFDNYQFPLYKFAIEDWDFWVKKFPEIRASEFLHPKFNYFYVQEQKSLTAVSKIERSRIEHAISLMSDPKYRKIILENKIFEHHYSHLYMAARIWFPDLVKSVKIIKYRKKEPFFLRIIRFIIMLRIFNFLIRKKIQVINE